MKNWIKKTCSPFDIGVMDLDHLHHLRCGKRSTATQQFSLPGGANSSFSKS